MNFFFTQLMFLTLLLSSCATKHETVDVDTSSPPVLPAITEESVNLDLELQDKLKGIWKDYFVEEFNDTRAVNVFVITNRLLKVPAGAVKL